MSMNKFDKVRFYVDLVEAASTAVIKEAWRKIRYDSSCYDYAEDEDPEWYDDEWLKAHVNDSGREYLELAEEFARQLDELLM